MTGNALKASPIDLRPILWWRPLFTPVDVGKCGGRGFYVTVDFFLTVFGLQPLLMGWLAFLKCFI
jgi:hypothetical protein